jgi:phosphonate metabolism protein PhnN/1,5-bisphosphokinase (PRPP-forming)
MKGILFLIVGPSGVGKDTLIDGAKAQLADTSAYHFVQRFITRPSDAGGEDHIAIDPADFEHLRAEGGFALHWSAHGLSYGVPKDITSHLDQGRHVVVNVSRTILDAARARFSPLTIIAISALGDVIGQRLVARGRETAADIADRVARAAAYDVAGRDVVPLSNDGSVKAGIAQLVAILRRP